MTDQAHHAVSPMRPQRAPWQFSLRGMLILVAALCGVFAVMAHLGAAAAVVTSWILVLVVGHVTANAWGTHARGAQPARTQPNVSPPPALRPIAAPANPAPRSAHSPPQFGRFMLLATSTGALMAGGLGSAALAHAYWGRIGVAAVILGGASSALLGGFFGFMTSSLLVVLRAVAGDAPSPHVPRHAATGDKAP